jgi:hypothetical protein
MHRELGQRLARGEGLDAEDCYRLLCAGWSEWQIVHMAKVRRNDLRRELFRVGRADPGELCRRTADLLERGHLPRLAHDVRAHASDRCGLGAIGAAEKCLGEDIPRLPSVERGQLAVHLEVLRVVLEEGLVPC